MWFYRPITESSFLNESSMLSLTWPKEENSLRWEGVTINYNPIATFVRSFSTVKM